MRTALFLCYDFCMEDTPKKPSRRDALKSMGKAALVGGALVIGADAAKAMRELDTKDLSPDTKDFLKKEADIVDAMWNQVLEARKRGDAIEEERLIKLFKERILRDRDILRIPRKSE